MEALRKNIEMRHCKTRLRSHRLMNALRTQEFSITTSNTVWPVSSRNGLPSSSLP